jgi:hypothetical protein
LGYETSAVTGARAWDPGMMFIGSPTRDLFDHSVEGIAVVVPLLVVLDAAVLVYRSGCQLR